MGTEHHACKANGIPLSLWQRAADGPRIGTILFVHGSSMSGRPTFDLQVPSGSYVSPMEYFTTAGYEAWCLDCEGYGRSGKQRETACDIATGADDVETAARYIIAASDVASLFVYGVSSGALRAGQFAARSPALVARLVLDALVWTGEGSPTLAERRRRLPEYQSSLRRATTADAVRAIVTRDAGVAYDAGFVSAFVDAILAADPSVPNGSYVDMCAHLPLVQPEQLTMPTLILRGEHDSIASIEDVLNFFAALPAHDKQFTLLAGGGHSSFHGVTAHTAFAAVDNFFRRT